MKNMINLLVLTALLLVASNVRAVTINETFITPPVYGPGDAEFTVTNDSGSDIYAFFVANDSATNTWTNNNGWNDSIMSSAEWNHEATNINYLGGYDNPVYTSTLGSFDALFSGYNQVLMYSFNYYNFNGLEANPDAQPIANGATVGDFNFTTQILASPFVAIDINGNIVGSGEAVHGVSAVPVPAAAWLFGSGLLGLVGFARRKKA